MLQTQCLYDAYCKWKRKKMYLYNGMKQHESIDFKAGFLMPYPQLSIVLNLKHFYRTDNTILCCLEDLAPNYKFVQYAINLVKIENDVQLAYVSKILVESLY
jgi:hypothetical protein